MRTTAATLVRSWRRGVTLLALLAVSAACSQSPTSPSRGRAGDDHFGIVTQTWSPDIARWVGDLGTGWVRLDFNWFELEPARNAFDWGDLDMRVMSARAQGLRIYATLAYTPDWAGPCRHCMPYDVADWRDFVQAVLAHYRGSVAVFGVWNEPNLGFLDDTPDGAEYGRLFAEANVARLRVDPEMVLGGPETSHHAWPSYYEAVMDRVRPSMRPSDAVTVHYYPDAPLGLNAYMQSIQGDAGGHLVWLTETGVGTCDDALQRQYVSDVLNAFQGGGRTWWAKTFLYVLYNGEPMCSGALIGPGGTYRPAFLFYRDFIRDHP